MDGVQKRKMEKRKDINLDVLTGVINFKVHKGSNSTREVRITFEFCKITPKCSKYFLQAFDVDRFLANLFLSTDHGLPSKATLNGFLFL